MSTAIVLPGFERLAAEFGPDAPADLPRLIAEFERDNRERVCIGCGQTDIPCIDPDFGPVDWVADFDGDLCTACADHYAQGVCDEAGR